MFTFWQRTSGYNLNFLSFISLAERGKCEHTKLLIEVHVIHFVATDAGLVNSTSKCKPIYDEPLALDLQCNCSSSFAYR